MAEEKPVEEKPVEERRGTTSPTGKYRLGSTIDIPLVPESPPGGSKEEVIERQQRAREDILDALGDDKDPEAVTLRHRVESGNVDELELAQIKMHLADPAHQEAREKMRADAEERAAEQQAKEDERAAEKAKKDEERAAKKAELDAKLEEKKAEREAKKAQEQSENPPT